MQLLDQAKIKTTFIVFTILTLITPSITQALTLTDSGPITATQNGQVIENVRIHAVNEPAININNLSNVIIRNVEITHEGARGIRCSGADGLSIENVSITNIRSGSPLPSANESNIECEFSSGIIIKNARLRGGSSGIYLLESPNAHLSFIEGYDFRGPLPRGQLVQFNESPSCILEDFSAINNPSTAVSWTEQNVSIYRSDNCIIQRGLLDGNNSATGVGVMFELSSNGLVEDVDTLGQGNGSFFAYPGNNITFRRTRARDNVCVDQGRGAPSSNALVWGGDPGSSTGLRIEDSRYFNLCNPGNRVWDASTFDIIEYSSENFQPRDPIVNQFPWEDGVSARFTSSTSGLTVDFTDTSNSNAGTLVNWFWDFGGGRVSTLANPSHTYSVGGTYTVSLTVTDSNGSSDTSTLTSVINSTTQALTLTDSGPITATQNGQVIENVRIHAVNEPAININNLSNVVIRNVEITHEGARGIRCSGADGLSIENVSITNIRSSSPLPSANESNIECEFSSGIIIKRVRLRGGSSGIYLLESPNAHLSFIEGYDFRGPIPRGQLVQFNGSSSCILEDFSVINNPSTAVSWPEDNVSVYRSDNCVIQRGLLDGNNSATGVGVMFELSSNGLVEDVDTLGQGNGSFFAYPGNNITFRRTRARDNVCSNQGRGLPSSNALVWGGDPSSSSGLRIEDSRYFNLCNPGNRVWDASTFDIIQYSSEDFQPRDPIVNQFPWEDGVNADFSFSISGLNVNFTDTSISNGGNVVNWFWDFGDGGVSTLANPSHTYSASGAYTVNLTVTDSNGSSDTSVKNVAASEAPIADFSFNVSNLTANFTDNSIDNDGTIVSRSWNFGDGNTSTATNPSHTYSAQATYTVSLTVTDNDGLNDSVATNVTVTVSNTNQAPNAGYTSSISGLNANFTDTSTDSDGSIASRSWSFGDGGTSTSQNPSHTYSSTGIYTVNLTVTDNDGASDTFSQSVTAIDPNQAPTAGFASNISNLTVSFTDTSSDNDGTIASRSWNFGDGGTSTSINPSHTYAASGNYTISLVVTDNDGASDTYSRSVTVVSPSAPPQVSYLYCFLYGCN